MGEYAEMMLDGTCCSSCGEYLFNDDPEGFPVMCPGCQEAYDDAHPKSAPKNARGFPCEECNAVMASEKNWRRHMRKVHGLTNPAEAEG